MKKRKAEILAPCGSPEAVVAAVRAGADAVYLGGKELNARRGAANFGQEELRESVAYCHGRGVKVYLTLNIAVFDEELPLAIEAVKFAGEIGIDAIILSDLGVARIVRSVCPTMPLHASTQTAVHTLEGVRELSALGFSRVVLAREMSRAEIENIAQNTDTELEVFVHGALCVCLSGQCYFSSMIGGRSGNRGLCAQPCRLPFSVPGGTGYDLSLRDLSLVDKIPALAEIGIASLKIEGRMKRPEYVAAAVAACKNARDASPDPHLRDMLGRVFSRSGFTNAYFAGNPSPAMFGTRKKEDVTAAASVLSSLQNLYHKEVPLVPIEMEFTMQPGLPVRLNVTDGQHIVTEEGEIPQQACTKPTTEERAAENLKKTGSTPFYVQKLKLSLAEGLMLPVSSLNSLRRSALDSLLAKRSAAGKKPVFSYTPEKIPPRAPKKPVLRAHFSSLSQLSEKGWEGMAAVFLPIEELYAAGEDIPPSLRERTYVELPRMMFSLEEELSHQLEKLYTLGYRHGVAGNIGHIRLLREAGFTVHGSFALNVTNTEALLTLKSQGLADCEASFELSAQQLSRLGGVMPLGVYAYGRQPLMITRACPVQNGGKGCADCDGESIGRDRMGNEFPIRCAGVGREILNCHPLYLADRLGEFSADYFDLWFTTESAKEAEKILAAYRQGKPAEEKITRGLYYRKVY